MLLNTITVKHPNSFVLLKPKSRDEQNHVRDWNVLNPSKKYDDTVVCNVFDLIPFMEIILSYSTKTKDTCECFYHGKYNSSIAICSRTFTGYISYVSDGGCDSDYSLFSV